MRPDEQIAALASQVKARCTTEGSHDWWHIWRVWQMARRLALAEGADLYTVEVAALCHDLEDWKYPRPQPVIQPLLSGLGVPQQTLEQVCYISQHISYQGAGVPDQMEGLEGQVVQDADRLDAIGAVGIARAFAYGGAKHRPLYDPQEQPELHQSFAAYRSKSGSSLAHFHEKLYWLKERLHTPSARRMAEARHAFMQEFEARFLLEWRGEA